MGALWRVAGFDSDALSSRAGVQMECEWERLTPSEHIYWCYLMAEEARQRSESAPPDMKQTHREMADLWSKVASDIGRTLSSRLT